jgi:hypothetical protein
MSTSAPIIIERSNLSLAWADAFMATLDSGRSGLRPLVITVGDFPSLLPPEDLTIRAALDHRLVALGKNPSDVSGMMIFPYKPWIRRGMPGCAEFAKFCMERLLPRLKKLDKRNQKGTYFERMMAYSGVRRSGTREVNQLQFVIDLMRKPRRQRQSALQIACFDPAKDHTGQAVRGFPCLQQVSIAYDDHGNLALNAYYPTQYLFDRAYGNYLGLCHLGHFLAHETKLRFARLTCFIGRPERGDVRMRDIGPLLRILSNAIKEPAVESTSENAEGQ